MKKSSLKFVICAVLMLLYGVGQAQIHQKAGTVGGQFLKIGVGARAAAMGDSYCAVSEDVNTIFWNPAGLCRVQDPELSLYHNKWIADINRQTLAFAYPSDIGVFAGGIVYLYMDELIGRDEDGYESVPRFRSYDMAGIISYSSGLERFIENARGISAGMSCKFLYNKIADESASGFAIDVGGLYEMGTRWTRLQGLTVGLSIQNLGPGLRFDEQSDPLPLNIKLGTAYRLMDNNMMIVMDINKYPDSPIKPGLGLEYIAYGTLRLRGGFLKKTELGNGIRLGIGFEIGEWMLDYAYVPAGDFEDTHRMSILVKFGKERTFVSKKETPETPPPSYREVKRADERQETGAVQEYYYSQTPEQKPQDMEMDLELERLKMLRGAVEGLTNLILGISQ